MLYQGIIGGGSSPVEPVDLSPVLLWTNPSPTSAFEVQTVSLNLTEYAGVIVEFNESASTTNFINRSFIKKGEDALGAGTVAYTNVGLGRKVSCNDTGVTFGQGYASAADSNLIIPVKIYGVKEYVVEPVGTQMGIYAYGNNNSEQYADYVIENCKFKQLKVVSYENIAASYAEYPKIIIDNNENSRPSEGTVFNVYNKNVKIIANTATANWTKTGIKVEFL